MTRTKTRKTSLPVLAALAVLAVSGASAASCGGVAPEKQLPCGTSTCDAATEYCDHVFVDTGGTPDQFLCEPIPAGQCTGAAPSCDCLKVFRCQCSEDAKGGVTIDRGGAGC